MTSHRAAYVAWLRRRVQTIPAVLEEAQRARALRVEYAIVPHVEREEFVNAGVILYCEDRALLLARIELDEARLLAIAPDSISSS